MKHLLFDFDGTLMDTWPGIEATLRTSLQVMEIPFEKGSITPTLVGIPLARVFEKLLPGDPAGAGLAVKKYRELFPDVGMPAARPYDGVLGMLEELRIKDRDLFLVTARNETVAKQMMEDHGLSRFFTWVRGEQENEVPRGKSGMVAEVLDRFALDPLDCVVVGDRRYDVEAASANGIRAIGVTYGYGTKDELVEAGASKLVGSVEEMKKILMERG